MLKQIIIWAEKKQTQNIDYEAVRKYEWAAQCKKKGIEITFIDSKNQFETLLTDLKNTLLIKDSLLITNMNVDSNITIDSSMIIHSNLDMIPIIGLGLDYRGSCTFIMEDLGSVDLSYFEMVYARFYGLPLTIAESERLLIREITLQDLDELYKLYETLENSPFIEPLYERKEEERFTRDYIKNMYGFYGYGHWLIYRKKDGQLIGRAGIENRELDGENVQELGYLIGQPWQRQHYAEEACRIIMDYARWDLGLEHLFLCSEQKNIPSIALAHKLGFQTYAKDVDGMNVYYYRLNA